jgi:hypothetical protein
MIEEDKLLAHSCSVLVFFTKYNMEYYPVTFSSYFSVLNTLYVLISSTQTIPVHIFIYI